MKTSNFCRKVPRLLGKIIFGVAVSAFLSCIITASALGAETKSQNSVNFPDLLITEICSDTYGFTDSTNVTNKSYVGQGGDCYEFLEIYNNSDHRINIYDYCLIYNGSANTSSSFEKQFAEMTPFMPGKAWIDGWDASKYWTGKTKMPENPAYEDGYIESGHCAVIWSYYCDSHRLNATLEEFRTYWSIPDDVLVICFDGNSETSGNKWETVNGVSVVKDGHAKNFNVKNSAVGSYCIARKVDEFEYANTSGFTLSQVFTTCDDLISWSVMDYTNIIGNDKNYIANRASTVNFAPSFTSYNGLYGDSGGKRCEFLYCTPYESSSVGRLTEEQIASLGERYVYLDENQSITLSQSDTEGVLSYYVEHTESAEGRHVYTDVFTAKKSGVYAVSVRDPEFRTGYGASVRLTGGSGIRFASYLKKNAYLALKEDEDVAEFRLGTLIAPRLYAEKCSGEYTVERLNSLGLDYLDVKASDFYGEVKREMQLFGSVLSIMESHYLLEYSARGYVDIVFKNGEIRRVYADFDIDGNSRSPYEVALAAYNHGQTEISHYLDGVCDIVTLSPSEFAVRSYADALDGIVRPQGITVEQNFSCRNDSNLNVWITSKNGKNPKYIFVDGKLAASFGEDGKYTVNEKLAFEAKNEEGGVMLCMRYTSALDGLSKLTATKTDPAGLKSLDKVKLSLERVYYHASEIKNGTKYYILQSCCSDGKYIYYCMNESSNLTNMLVKAELATGKIVARTYANTFDHANGITYNVRTNELVIVHNDNKSGKDDNKKWISIVDAETLAVKATKKLEHKLYCVEYVAYEDRYIFGIAGKYDYAIYDSSFTSVGDTHKGVNTGITKQDMTTDRDYLIFPQFKSVSGKYYSYLSVYTHGDRHIGLVELYSDSGIYYEIEDCFSVAGELYFAYYCSGYGFRLYRADIKIG